MVKKFWLAMAVFSLFWAGCSVGSSGEDPETEPFTVTVLTSSGDPLEGAVIEGGIDWDSFEVATDADGHATLPTSAWSVDAMIHLDNYFPQPMTLKRPYEYELAPTPKRLRLLGGIEGQSVRFEPDRLATVDYFGGYHLYAYSAQGLGEIASAEVPRTIKQIQVIDDTLWLSTHENGVYAYSLADLAQPREILHLAIPGYCPIFALRDNLIVVGNYGDVDSLGVYLFEMDGSFQETARFGNYAVSSIAFVEGYLVVTNYYNSHPKVYALSDPSNAVLMFDGANPIYWSGFLYGNQYIRIPHWDDITGNTVYGRLDLTSPAVPRTAGVFKADSRLIAVADDATAIGYYYAMGNALSVLKGGLTSGFSTAAIISEDPRYDLNEFEGCFPPYFIISKRLWILEDRPAPAPSK